ncbi:MAG TPA: hypothetical protein VGK67_05135 [Myxococcales bacterium]|jgi:hypothetical protein
MRRALLAILAVLSLANCDALCFKSDTDKICPGDPCTFGVSDEYCVHTREKLFCAQDAMYDTISCDSCSSLYEADQRRFVAVCMH